MNEIQITSYCNSNTHHCVPNFDFNILFTAVGFTMIYIHPKEGKIGQKWLPLVRNLISVIESCHVRISHSMLQELTKLKYICNCKN